MTEGVTIHDAGKAFEGYTLYSETFMEPRCQGETERQIYLIDMNGELAHTWHVETTLQSYCQLLPDGNLVYPTHDRSDVARGPFGLFEIDPNSRAVWSYSCRADHDFQILPNGHFLIHTITESMCPPLGPELKRHPYIVETTRDKELVWEWRGEEHLEELEELLPAPAWQHVMRRARGEFAFDWAHNNTLQVIAPNQTHEKERQSGGPTRFRPGNIVISYRSIDVVAVIERDSGRMVWAWGPGILDGQHKPHMLSNGNLLIFDNGTLRGYSRVIEVNPLSEEIEWEYTGTPRESFHSKYISSAHRLPNGNTLICEGNKPRLLEVTADKETVWEFANPYRNERALPSIYRCLRYPPEYVAPLFERSAR